MRTTDIPAPAPTPKNNQELVELTIGDYQYLAHGAGCIAQAANRIAKGEVITFECFSMAVAEAGKNKYQLAETKHIGIGKCDGKKALRESGNKKDLFEASSCSIIATWYDESIVMDPAHIAAALAYWFKGYYFIREQPKK